MRALLLLIAAAAPALCAPALEIMVLSDGPKIRRADPWPAESPVFDRGTREIRLYGARNETLGFQILLRPAPGIAKVPAVRVEAGALKAAALEFFRAWYVDVAEPSFTGGIRGLGPGQYPDPLVPLRSPKYGAPFAVERPEMLFADLYIPPETPPGSYGSTITISSGTRVLHRLRLNLRVWNFTLPRESHFLNYFAYEQEFLRWGFRKRPGENVQALERQLFDLASRHRANLSLATRLKASEREWEEWAAPYAPYLDGPAYGWRLIAAAAEAGETLAPKLKLAADWLERKGWLGKFVVVGFDEPKRDQYEQVRRIGRITREATGGRLKHFLPGARPDPLYEDYVDVWDSVWVADDLPRLAERRKAGQRVWYCGGLGAPANPVDDSRAYGARSWAWVARKYGFEGFEMWQSCYWADKYNLPIPVRAAIDRDPERFLNVWKNPAPLTFDESRKREGRRRDGDILQNGGAVFFYPGYDAGLPGECVASLRLKDFRRGAQDYEYLLLLDHAGEKAAVAEALAAVYNPAAITLVRGGSSKVATGDLGVTMDDAVWERVRRGMGERLARASARH